MYNEVKTLVTDIAFPECLRWHENKLWFSDVLGGKVFNYDPLSHSLIEVAQIKPMAGGLGWLNTGEFLAVNIESRKVMQIGENGTSFEYLDLSHDWQYPANDMLIDSNGTMWIGSYGFNPEIDTPQASSLARFKNGILDFPVPGLVFPNGIAQLESNQLVVAETFADRLAILHILPGGNVRIDRRIQLPKGSTPDGICIDAAGMIWVASAYGAAVLRVNPLTEVVERAIEIPGRGVFDVAIGGSNQDILFIATSDEDESRALLDLPGEILAVDLA